MKLNKPFFVLSLTLLAATAQAQSADLVVAVAPASDAGSKAFSPASAVSPVTANVTLASQYVSRGFRQTWGKPALQGGFDYVHPSGFSAGTWLSNVSNRYIENGTIEWDLYGGYTGAAGDIGYSGIVYYYKYPGAVQAATNTKYDYGELSLGLSYKFLYAKYYYTYTKDSFGITDARGTGYMDLGANYDMGSGYTLNLHYGIGRVASNAAADNSIFDWKDYKVGVSKSFEGGWTLVGAYTKAKGATNVYDNYTTGALNTAGVAETSNPAAGTFVLSLNKTF
ncbi:MAG: choline dehydrogenase [Glaciimonas sp.]|nr:choline dehydrogenase [Glaciimonas sp.]